MKHKKPGRTMHHTFRCRQKYRLFLLFIILGVAKSPIPPLVDHSLPPFQTQSCFPDFKGLDQAAFDHHVGLFPTLCGELTGGPLTATLPQSAEKSLFHDVPKHLDMWNSSPCRPLNLPEDYLSEGKYHIIYTINIHEQYIHNLP